MLLEIPQSALPGRCPVQRSPVSGHSAVALISSTLRESVAFAGSRCLCRHRLDYEEKTCRTAGAGAGGEVTVEYYRGLPQVTVPLPSRRERCRFTLRPVSNTVGDFLAMLRHEDHGIDRVAVSSLDDVRIASSNTIEVLMENDFKLIVNDSVYVVNTPRQERLTQEELQRLSDVRNLVNQMYEALNVEEHQLHKERELCSQLEELKVELEPMEQKRQELEQIASRRTNILTWVGLGLMSVQFGILARLTWWEYSWDIMEPVTYFVTYGTAMAAYAYFVLTRQEYLLPDVKDRQHLIILHKRARKVGLDLGRYNQLKDSIAQLEADLRRLRDPLQLHLPPHHLSSARSRPGAGADATEPRSPLERAQAHIRSLLQRGRSATRGST
ncbi:calcium uniporter protein, mitochondrial [Schistocerca gregaria]|uniref:calcium uniporter protein, mitochondrial n=1 Tax=Schistocerca gregaria TaxID=7010 RepID=UPI00211E3BE7|nr:calcium uniporter protein, mitochondrial [Schistocerca gregaria]